MNKTFIQGVLVGASVVVFAVAVYGYIARKNTSVNQQAQIETSDRGMGVGYEYDDAYVYLPSLNIRFRRVLGLTFNSISVENNVISFSAKEMTDASAVDPLLKTCYLPWITVTQAPHDFLKGDPASKLLGKLADGRYINFDTGHDFCYTGDKKSSSELVQDLYAKTELFAQSAESYK